MTVLCLLTDEVGQNQLCILSHKETECTCAVVLFFSTTPTHIQKQTEAHALRGGVRVCTCNSVFDFMRVCMFLLCE